MPDAVSSSDQALIDAFLAKNKVTKVPAGTTSQAPYVWNGRTLESTGPGWREASRRKSRKSGTTPEVAARRIKVSDLIHDGKTAEEAADALGVSLQVIYKDCSVLGLGVKQQQKTRRRAAPKPEPALTAPTAPKAIAAKSRHDPRVEKNRAAIRDAFDGKKTAAQIGRETGIHIRTVKSHLSALGLTPPSPYKRELKEAIERRAQLPALVASGMTNPQLAEKFGVSTSAISADCKRLGLSPNRTRRRDAGGNEGRRAQIPRLIEEGLTGPQIAQRLGCSRATIYKDCTELGISIPRRGRAAGRVDHIAEEKARKAERKRAEVRDRRRFKTTPVPTGQASRLAPQDLHETMFPHSRRGPLDGNQTVLKDGANSSKIGGGVLKGRLKGAKILTLTLEERATCPRSCLVYRECYGNGMQYAHRFAHGPGLMRKLAEELKDACRANEMVLVRLHVLGDFWSVEYVEFWRGMLADLPNLHAFGFTARPSGTQIGDAINALRSDCPDRFMIRTSGRSGEWGSFTIDFPTEKKRIGDAIVCPEQTASMNGDDDGRHCGNCGFCWASRGPVAFVEH